MRISFKTDKLAKEKGFYEECSQDSPRVGVIKVHPPLKNSIIDEPHATPTQAELQAWLRKLQIHVVVSPIHETEEVNSLIKYWYYILDVMQEDEIYFSTWEEALEAGLQEGLTKIKNYENITENFR